ncbi:hypothetical protein PWT90_01745 [Aphanocladium album]|nr:hypothetical protein PWT90_01745 [Aphanocladium album]
MRQFVQACQLVGHRLLVATTSPSADWFCTLFCIMLGAKALRLIHTKTSAERRAVATFGVLWGALLGSHLISVSISTQQRSTVVMILAAWLILVGRIDTMLAQVDSRLRYYAAIECVQTGMFVLTLGLCDWLCNSKPAIGSAYTMCTISITAVLLVMLLTKPHGPDEFSGGRPVDREHTSSLIERLTFMWARKILTPEKMKEARLRDLPDLRSDIKMKTRSLPDFRALRDSGTVSGALLFTHAFPLLLQCTLAILDAFIALAPELLTYKLLNWLGSNADSPKILGVFFSFALGISKLASVTVNSWLKWITATRVLIPIQSSMVAMMYQKALRMRDDINNTSTKPGAKGTTLLEMRNCCTNACSFYTDFHKIIVILTKLAISILLLLKLLGWHCLIAGVAVTAISMPLSTIISRRYAKTLAATTQLHEEQSAILSTALLCIRQIKLSAEEKSWKERLGYCREKELSNILSSAIWMTLLVFADDVSPIILAGVPIYVFTLLGNPLGSSVAFTSISLFKEVQHAMSALPMILPYQWNYWNELQRLEVFLSRPEVDRNTTPGDRICFTNASVAWSSNIGRKQFTLENICADFPVGELSLITGKTGSGKSLLLAAIAGEAELISGTISRPCDVSEEDHMHQKARHWLLHGRLAFVTQNAWMSNDTIKNNIIFGSTLDPIRYKNVLHACALEKDLKTLKDGDHTVIGIKGATISGGQRWRIALARALYSRATLLLLDDVLSAVDAEVRKWIAEKALCGELALGRTRILVTHHVHQLSEQAVYQVNLSNRLTTTQIQAERGRDAKKTTTVESTLQNSMVPIDEAGGASTDNHISASEKLPNHHIVPAPKAEDTQEGGYRLYYSATGGIITWSIALLTIFASESTALWASWWLKRWTSLDAVEQQAQTRTTSPATMYMLISTLSCLISAARCFVWYLVGVKGSRALSSMMVDHLFGASLQWLESTSHGEILTMFGDELGLVDDRLPHALGFVIESTFTVAFIIFTNASYSFYEAPLVALLFYIFVTTGLRLLSVQRSVKTIQNSSVSTIQQHLSSLQAPDGVITARSYGMTSHFTSHMYDLMDDRYSAYWNFSLCNTMIGFQFGALGALYVLLSSLFIVMAGANAGSAGMALTLASKLSNTISNSLKRMVAVESDLQSVEQIMQYLNVEQEPRNGTEMPLSWPAQGRIRVQKLTVGYGAATADALQDITFSIGAGERVGVVGRTGAGKSSLSLALARLIKRRSGSIFIDDVDIHQVKLATLRQRLLVIPQDVYLSAGTLRSLIDPDSKNSDSLLLDYLNAFHFSSATISKDGSESDNLLSTEVSGNSLSPGQRQIASLVRAVLANRKIIIMDEATSAVDMEADEAIQRVLRGRGTQSLLKDATILVIAHRIATVAEMDKVLVLADGKLAEYGAPKTLYQQRGAFWKLVNHSVEREHLVRKYSW